MRTFRFMTWLGFTFIVAISTAMGAVGLTFGGILAWFWLASRDRKYRAMQREMGVGEAAREVELVKELTDAQDKVIQASVIDCFSSTTIACKTCGTPNPRSMFPQTQKCVGLQGILDHRPSDEPADDNPYKNWWCQLHGYEPPPEDWPTGKLFLHSYAHHPDFIQIAQARGKQYWLTHANYAWDNGFAEPPDWYVSARIERSAIA